MCSPWQYGQSSTTASRVPEKERTTNLTSAVGNVVDVMFIIPFEKLGPAAWGLFTAGPVLERPEDYPKASPSQNTTRATAEPVTTHIARAITCFTAAHPFLSADAQGVFWGPHQAS